MLVRVRQEVQALLWQTHAALTAKALLPPARTSYVGKGDIFDISGMALSSHLPAFAPSASPAPAALAA